MKRFYLLLYFLLINACMYSQNHTTFIQEGRTWNCIRGYLAVTGEMSGSHYYYALHGDTIINGEKYKKLFVCGNDTITEEEYNKISGSGETLSSSHSPRYFAALRENANKVFWIKKGFHKEELLYDFEEGIYSFPEYGFTLQVNTPLMFPIDPTNNMFQNVFICKVRHESENTNEAGKTLFLSDGIGCEKEPFKVEEWNEIIGFGSFMLSVYDEEKCVYDWNSGSLSARYAYYQTNSINSVMPHFFFSKKCFDLQGRRLTQEPKSGVFIKDGKKVMK